MTAQLTDNFMQVAAEGAITYMTGSGKNVGATSFTVNNATGWPTTTGFIVAVRQVTAAGIEVAGTYCEFIATLSGTTLTINPSPVVGTDQQYTAASTTQCFVPVSSTRDNKLVNAILAQHNQNGTHQGLTNTGGMTTDTLTISGANGISGVGYTNANLTNPYKFSVYINAGGTTVPGGDVAGKILLDTKLYDTGSNFDATTNHRFTAPISGFYHFSASVQFYCLVNVVGMVQLFKNGSIAKTGGWAINGTGGTNHMVASVSGDLQLTAGDYVEVYGYSSQGSATSIDTGQSLTYFDGFLVSKT